jgi:hypothetical protein
LIFERILTAVPPQLSRTLFKKSIALKSYEQVRVALPITQLRTSLGPFDRQLDDGPIQSIFALDPTGRSKLSCSENDNPPPWG